MCVKRAAVHAYPAGTLLTEPCQEKSPVRFIRLSAGLAQALQEKRQTLQPRQRSRPKYASVPCTACAVFIPAPFLSLSMLYCIHTDHYRTPTASQSSQS